METRRQKRRGEDAQGTPPTETPAKLLQPPRSVRSAAALSMEQEQEELQHAATAARELAVAVEPLYPKTTHKSEIAPPRVTGCAARAGLAFYTPPTQR